jgi:hypothetical protein
MTKNRAVFAVAAVALLVLAGCGSMGYPSGRNYPSGSYNNEIQGTVNYVDRNAGYVELTNASGYGPMLSSSGSGNTVRIYYDRDTAVQYNGRNYRVEDLDQGDQVDVRVSQSGNRLIADSMTVTYNANASSSYPNNGSYSSTVMGTVRSVDTANRTIQLDQTNSYGTTMTVQYDPNTTNVDISGRLYPVSGLERGDVIEVQMSNAGSSLPFAQRITLVRNVRQ